MNIPHSVLQVRHTTLVALSAFDDKARPPQDEELAQVLAEAHPLWQSLRSAISDRFAPIDEDWGFSGAKYGWGLRLKQKKRAVLYMTPCAGYFLASFALGEKAVRAAHEANLQASVLEAIDQAPKYAEGRGVRLEVRSQQDLDNVARLAEIKMAH